MDPPPLLKRKTKTFDTSSSQGSRPSEKNSTGGCWELPSFIAAPIVALPTKNNNKLSDENSTSNGNNDHTLWLATSSLPPVPLNLLNGSPSEDALLGTPPPAAAAPEVLSAIKSDASPATPNISTVMDYNSSFLQPPATPSSSSNLNANQNSSQLLDALNSGGGADDLNKAAATESLGVDVLLFVGGKSSWETTRKETESLLLRYEPSEQNFLHDIDDAPAVNSITNSSGSLLRDSNDFLLPPITLTEPQDEEDGTLMQLRHCPPDAEDDEDEDLKDYLRAEQDLSGMEGEHNNNKGQVSSSIDGDREILQHNGEGTTQDVALLRNPSVRRGKDASSSVGGFKTSRSIISSAGYSMRSCATHRPHIVPEQSAEFLIVPDFQMGLMSQEDWDYLEEVAAAQAENNHQEENSGEPDDGDVEAAFAAELDQCMVVGEEGVSFQSESIGLHDSSSIRVGGSELLIEKDPPKHETTLDEISILHPMDETSSSLPAPLTPPPAPINNSVVLGDASPNDLSWTAEKLAELEDHGVWGSSDIPAPSGDHGKERSKNNNENKQGDEIAGQSNLNIKLASTAPSCLPPPKIGSAPGSSNTQSKREDNPSPPRRLLPPLLSSPKSRMELSEDMLEEPDQEGGGDCDRSAVIESSDDEDPGQFFRHDSSSRGEVVDSMSSSKNQTAFQLTAAATHLLAHSSSPGTPTSDNSTAPSFTNAVASLPVMRFRNGTHPSAKYQALRYRGKKVDLDQQKKQQGLDRGTSTVVPTEKADSPARNTPTRISPKRSTSVPPEDARPAQYPRSPPRAGTTSPTQRTGATNTSIAAAVDASLEPLSASKAPKPTSTTSEASPPPKPSEKVPQPIRLAAPLTMEDNDQGKEGDKEEEELKTRHSNGPIAKVLSEDRDSEPQPTPPPEPTTVEEAVTTKTEVPATRRGSSGGGEWIPPPPSESPCPTSVFSSKASSMTSREVSRSISRTQQSSYTKPNPLFQFKNFSSTSSSHSSGLVEGVAGGRALSEKKRRQLADNFDGLLVSSSSVVEKQNSKDPACSSYDPFEGLREMDEQKTNKLSSSSSLRNGEMKQLGSWRNGGPAAVSSSSKPNPLLEQDDRPEALLSKDGLDLLSPQRRPLHDDVNDVGDDSPSTSSQASDDSVKKATQALCEWSNAQGQWLENIMAGVNAVSVVDDDDTDRSFEQQEEDNPATVVRKRTSGPVSQGDMQHPMNSPPGPNEDKQQASSPPVEKISQESLPSSSVTAEENGCSSDGKSHGSRGTSPEGSDSPPPPPPPPQKRKRHRHNSSSTVRAKSSSSEQPRKSVSSRRSSSSKPPKQSLSALFDQYLVGGSSNSSGAHEQDKNRNQSSTSEKRKGQVSSSHDKLSIDPDTTANLPPTPTCMLPKSEETMGDPSTTPPRNSMRKVHSPKILHEAAYSTPKSRNAWGSPLTEPRSARCSDTIAVNERHDCAAFAIPSILSPTRSLPSAGANPLLTAQSPLHL